MTLEADGDLVRALRQRIDDCLASLIGPGPVALVDFPNFRNVGDSAIWAGTVSYLDRAGRTRAYVCDPQSYSRQALARAVGDGTILIQGGGNLGDVWPYHQHFRERVIAEFPGNRIVQLPQTIFFRDTANLERTRAVFARHPDLHLLVRDVRSLRTAREQLASADVVLCPDMAFSLSTLTHTGPSDRSIVWLCRTDDERTDLRAEFRDMGIEPLDWLGRSRGPEVFLRPASRLLARLIAGRPARAPGQGRIVRPVYDRLARSRVDYGRRLLCRGAVVVTDRLHGHILSLLLGIPHVVLDNRYGKVRQFHETWTSGAALTRWSDSPAEAAVQAQAWVGRASIR